MRSLKNKNRLFLGIVKAEADLSTAKFLYFYGPKFSDHEEFELNEFDKILNHRLFNPTNKTAFYLHGYLENKDVESVQVIVEAYLLRHDYNIIVLDWGELAEGNYLLDAVVNAKQLGSKLAKILFKAMDDGLNIQKFHIIGHSLGGQMAGVIGNNIKVMSKGEKILKRISALDPAFPPFYFNLSRHINKHDAEFVDIIHTDAWLYGAPISTGTADFWPNGGKTLQPGCPPRNYKMLTDNDLSSHRRSWWFWAESVSKQFDNKFNAIKAKSWNDFKSNRVLNETFDVYMGNDCPSTATGDYYLQTNGEKPYAKGDSGIRYIAEQ